MVEPLPPYTSRDNHTVSIAVMGATGSGKTTFVNTVSGSNLVTSDRLESCTQEVQTGTEFLLDDRLVKLIDTPGFDDTDRSEVQILKLIADYLANQYGQRATLHGVLYFHRISDIRMGGVSKRSFRLFRNLCGDATLKNVVIVTNMWGNVTLKEGQAREEELSTDDRFFKPALDEKAIMHRHDNTIESARDIIRKIFENHPLPLAIQKEVVDDRTPLHETNVGKVLTEDLKESAQWFLKEMKNLKDDIAESMQQRDEKARRDLADALLKTNADLARVQNEMKNLRARMVNDIDVARQWKKMDQKARVATLFRRSQGASEAPEIDNFWSALGDTTKVVSEIRAVFDQSPLPPNLQTRLLENTSAPDDDARGLIKSWVKMNPKGFRAMEVIVENTVKNKVKRRPWSFWWP